MSANFTISCPSFWPSRCRNFDHHLSAILTSTCLAVWNMSLLQSLIQPVLFCQRVVLLHKKVAIICVSLVMINYIVYLCMVLQVLLPDYLGHMLGHGDLLLSLCPQDVEVVDLYRQWTSKTSEIISFRDREDKILFFIVSTNALSNVYRRHFFL